MQPLPQQKITIFSSFSGHGGVEHMLCNLITEFVRLGLQVDLLLIKQRGDYLARLPAEVNIIRLGTDHTWLSLWPLIRYLKSTRPQAVLVAKHRAGIVALLARRFSAVPSRIVLRLGTTVSSALDGKGGLKKWLWYASMRHFYKQADKIIAVSSGVAEDIRQITGLSGPQVEVIHNPVITTQLPELARQAIDHDWFNDSKTPVIVGIGRLTRQKDFPTLLMAFAKARQQRDCRLMILGEGAQRQRLEALAAELNISTDVALPGYIGNPYPYLAGASLFVLSSRWEGSPNALTEAMALGTPVVSTDCPSGPREILQGGHYGRLCPVDDSECLAQAILDTLDNPPAADFIKSATVSYNVETSARNYLRAMNITTPEQTNHN